jgi:hypothetical protein
MMMKDHIKYLENKSPEFLLTTKEIGYLYNKKNRIKEAWKNHLLNLKSNVIGSMFFLTIIISVVHIYIK